jgi:hypothetical protein
MNVLSWAHNAYLVLLAALVMVSVWAALKTEHDR